MKTSIATCLCSAAIGSAVPLHAQLSASFGPLAPDASSGPLTLNVSSKPADLNLSTTWQIVGGYIQPVADTPREVETAPGSGIFVPNQETYTITIANLVVKVASADSLITGIGSGADPGFTSIAGDPTFISLGQFQYQITLTMPAGTQGADYPQISFPPPSPTAVLASKNAVLSLSTAHSLTTEDFDVTYYSNDGDGAGISSGPPVADGGKGVQNYSITDRINGTLTVVPETSHWAMLAGLGLVGFAGWRRYHRTSLG